MKTLIIDSSELVYIKLAKVLFNENCDVFYAKNVTDGYQYILDEVFDLIVLDINLCEKGDCVLLNSIKNIVKVTDTSVLFLMDKETVYYKEKIKKIGVNNYMVKPLCLDTFKNILETVKKKTKDYFDFDRDLTFKIKYVKYKRIKGLFSNYLDMNMAKFEYIKSKLVLKYYKKGETIYSPDNVSDMFIFMNNGVAKAIQNNTNKLNYLYFNNSAKNNKDYSHNIIQDYYSYIYSKKSNVRFEALTDCEVLYARYDDIEDIFVKYDCIDKFKYMLSDLEVKRIKKQTEENLEDNWKSRIDIFIKNNSYLLSMISYQQVFEYLNCDDIEDDLLLYG